MPAVYPNNHNITFSKRLILLVVVVSWLPIEGLLQLIGYVFPLVLFFIAARNNAVKVSARRVSFGLIFVICTLLFALFDSDNFHIENTLLGYLMISSLLILLLALPMQGTYNYFLKVIAISSIVETSLGISQLLLTNLGGFSFSSMGAGDEVVGTLLTNSHLFAVKMLFQALFLAIARAYGSKDQLVVIGLASALFGAILASALFITVLFFLGVSIAAFILLRMKSFDPGVAIYLQKLGRNIFLVLSLGFVTMLITQEENVGYIVDTISNATKQSENYGKVNSTIKSVELLFSEPEILLFGTGIGNYSSRAALLLSGEYLKRQPEGFPVSLSSYTNTIILPLWNRSIWGTEYSDGVLNQPFFTLQTVAVEGGLIGMLLLIIVFSRIVNDVIKKKYTDAIASMLKATVVSTLVVLPIIFLSDNWHEYPSFMLPVLFPISYLLNAKRVDYKPRF